MLDKIPHSWKKLPCKINLIINFELIKQPLSLATMLCLFFQSTDNPLTFTTCLKKLAQLHPHPLSPPTSSVYTSNPGPIT